MVNLREIIKKEEGNNDHIYLYKESDGWYAYEQSALYCYSLLGIVDVGWLLSSPEDAGSMIIRVHISGLDKLLNHPLLNTVAHSDTECVILCPTFCKGFHYWRDAQETQISYSSAKNGWHPANDTVDDTWLGVLFDQNYKPKEMSVIQQGEAPVIDQIYDPLSQRRDGTVTPCAPVLVYGYGLLHWSEEEVEFCLCPVEEPGCLIPAMGVYKHTDKHMLITMPHLEKGEYHPVFRMVNQRGQVHVYYFPDTWRVQSLSLVEIYTNRNKIHSAY